MNAEKLISKFLKDRFQNEVISREHGIEFKTCQLWSSSGVSFGAVNFNSVSNSLRR